MLLASDRQGILCCSLCCSFTLVLVKPTLAWRAKTCSQFTMLLLFGVQVFVSEVCGRNPFCNNEKPVQLSRACFSLFNIFATLFVPHFLFILFVFVGVRGYCLQTTLLQGQKILCVPSLSRGCDFNFLFSSNTVLEEIGLRSLRASPLRNPFLTSY